MEHPQRPGHDDTHPSRDRERGEPAGLADQEPRVHAIARGLLAVAEIDVVGVYDEFSPPERRRIAETAQRLVDEYLRIRLARKKQYELSSPSIDTLALPSSLLFALKRAHIENVAAVEDALASEERIPRVGRKGRALLEQRLKIKGEPPDPWEPPSVRFRGDVSDWPAAE